VGKSDTSGTREAGRTRTDPGIINQRHGDGDETPQKSAIKLDRGHDRKGLRRVTVQPSPSYAP